MNYTHSSTVAYGDCHEHTFKTRDARLANALIEQALDIDNEPEIWTTAGVYTVVFIGSYDDCSSAVKQALESVAAEKVRRPTPQKETPLYWV